MEISQGLRYNSDVKSVWKVWEVCMADVKEESGWSVLMELGVELS